MKAIKHYNIIILDLNYQTTDNDIMVSNHEFKLKDDIFLINENEEYSFDYLIFTDVKFISNFKSTNILHEGGIPVTNCLYQTSFENFYYTNPDSIDIAINNIINENE